MKQTLLAAFAVLCFASCGTITSEQSEAKSNDKYVRIRVLERNTIGALFIPASQLDIYRIKDTVWVNYSSNEKFRLDSSNTSMLAVIEKNNK